MEDIPPRGVFNQKIVRKMSTFSAFANVIFPRWTKPAIQRAFTKKCLYAWKFDQQINAPTFGIWR